MIALRAPFPWFGGKSRASAAIWEGLGDVANYVEPFAGSLAVLLGRPTPARTETVNDLDCYVANFWRALARDPEQLAEHADWPVNEADLHARHRWLVEQDVFREKMRRDPEFFDVRVAGWWVWGLSAWIGGGWCATATQTNGEGSRRASRRGVHKLALGGNGHGVGVHSDRRLALLQEWMLLRVVFALAVLGLQALVALALAPDRQRSALSTRPEPGQGSQR